MGLESRHNASVQVMESRSLVSSRHKRSKSDSVKLKEDNQNSSDGSSFHNLKLEMGKGKSHTEIKRKPRPVTLAKSSLKKEILQLERHLKDQLEVRGGLEKALGHKSSSTDSTDDSYMPKPTKELIKEIATLEIEVMYLEQYLLSLYRKPFDQQISFISPSSPKDISKRRLFKDEMTPNYSSSISESTVDSRHIPKFQKIDIKQAENVCSEKLTGPGVHRCQSVLSHRAVHSSRLSPSHDQGRNQDFFLRWANNMRT